MKRKILKVSNLLVLAAMLLLSDIAGVVYSAPRKEKDFFENKVITFIVGYKTGGGYDAWARIVSPGIKAYTGANIVIKNMPGAGSLLATNKIFVSDPNGLTIGIINGPGAMQSQMTEIRGAKFDLLKFTWLGRLTSEQRVICVGSKSKYKSIEDMRTASAPIKFGASGIGSPTYLDVSLIGQALNIKSEIITGYDTGNEVNLAVIRGELDATAASFSSAYSFIRNKDLIPVLQYGDVDMNALKGIPNMMDLPGVDNQGRELLDLVLSFLTVGRSIVAPPGLSSQRAAFLTEALKQSLEDKNFRKAAQKRKMEVLYLPPKAIREIVEKGLQVSPDLKQSVMKIMGR